MSPQFARQFDAFLRSTGVPIDVIVDLLIEVMEATPSNEWVIEDMQVIVNAYARTSTYLSVAQASEITLMARRLLYTANRNRRNQQRLDALVRDAQGIPGGQDEA